MCSHKKRRGERESGSEMEGGRKGEGKDNPQGLWLSLFQPQVLLPHTWSIPLPRALSSPPPIISPILSGDFQREMVEIKDSSSSDVSAICHARKGAKKKTSSRKKAMEKRSLS